MTPEDLIQSWYEETPWASFDEAITYVMWRIVKEHPEWFNADLLNDPEEMLWEASKAAEAHGTISEWYALMAAQRIIRGNPDWLQEPEPEPLTASDALMCAYMRADEDTPESPILWAAHLYAKSHPEWFMDWHKSGNLWSALESAELCAYDDADMTAGLLLAAAKNIAAAKPYLFD